MRVFEHKKILREIGGLRGDLLNATALQKSVIDSDQEQMDMGIDYSSQHVRLATVHTRQDLVLLVSTVGICANRLRQIRWLVVVLTVCAVLSSIKYLVS
jgi:hypothetical protein